MNVFKLALSVLISQALILSGSPYLVKQARAQQGPAVGVEVDPEVEKQQRVEELRRTLGNPKLGQAQLDPFDILRQRVIDERPERLDAIENKMSLEDYIERKQHFEYQIDTLNELDAKIDEKVKAVEPGSEKFSELHLVKSDIESRRKLAQLELTDLAQFDPRNGTKLPVDFMIDRQLQTRHYWGRNMRIRIEGPSGENLLEFRQRDFTNSLSPRFDKQNPIAELAAQQNVTFSILHPKGQVLNQFMIPIESIFFFGSFLVFVEKSSANSQANRSVRFIDMEYFKPNLGNAPLPVYTLPLNAVNLSEDSKIFAIEKGELRIGSQKMSYQQLALLAQTQQLVYNVNVALADPKTYDNVRPLIEEINEFFKKSMVNQEELFKTRMDSAIASTDFINQESQRLSDKPKLSLGDIEKVRALVESAMKDGHLSESEFKSIKTYLDADDGLRGSNKAIQDGRRLTTRIQLLFQFLIQPRPEGAPKLFESLVMLAMGDQDERSRSLEWLRGGISYKTLKYGSATGGLLLAGTMLPEPYAVNMYQSFDLIHSVFQHYLGYLKHINYGAAYFELGRDAFITSTTGWTYFFQTYFADGVWSKFLYGLWNVLLVPLKVFGSIHLTVNSYKMLRSTFEVRNLHPGEVSFLKAFKMAADRDQKAYWSSLAEAEKQVSGSDLASFGPEEERLLHEHIQRLKSGREDIEVLEKEIEKGRIIARKGPVTQFLSVITGFKKWFHFGVKTNDVMEKTASDLRLTTVDTLRGALASTFLSYASLRSTFKANATIWNYLFITRSYVFSPAKWLMFLIYPNYFNVTVTTREGRQHFPSKYNSGLDLWPQKLHRMVSAGIQKTSLRDSDLINRLFITKEGLSNLRAFEGYVGNMEAVAMEIAKSHAQKALIESIQDPKRIMVLFDSSHNPNEASTGIRNLHDSKIKELTNHERVFYRAFFTRTFDLVMQGFVSQMHSIDGAQAIDPETFAKEFVKGLRQGSITPVTFDPEKLSLLEKDMSRILNFSAISKWAEGVAHNSSQFINKVNIEYRHKLLETIHPGNPQIRRFLTAKTKVEQPRAMERAMRMEVASLTTSIPMGILSTLALYAGVQTGLIMPFDPEGMNTETHFRYMSRYLFYNGFIPGLLIGLMANTWMKVQEDARIDALGGFDKAVKFSDGKKGFWRYYLKNFFKNPDNKWAANHIYTLKLITANIPAAAVTIIVSNLYGLGRIDVGAFIAGYIMVYVTFLTGFGVKMSQAFELASGWMYNKIPRKLRASPQAQKYISVSLQKRKMSFAIFESVWSIVIDESIAGTMLTLKDNVRYGTRAFLRLVFGGETPTEIIVNFVNKLQLAFRSVPGLETATEAFKTLISKNYEAFERFPERLPLPPEGVERVVPDSSLPKSATGEFLGKFTAMVSSIGLFASLPYIGSEALQKRRESQLQKQGNRILSRSLAPKCSSLYQ